MTALFYQMEQIFLWTRIYDSVLVSEKTRGKKQSPSVVGICGLSPLLMIFDSFYTEHFKIRKMLSIQIY